MVHKDDPSKPLSPLGVKIIIERAAQKAKLFAPLKKNQKRREWQLTHGFRKAFKTRASEVMDHLIVEMCLDHDTGLAESYYKAQESTRRANYLKAVPLLMIEDANKNIDKITAEVTMKVTAGLNEQIRDLTNKYALTNFKREIDNIVANSKALALERIAEKGGELKKFEWSKEEQLEHFIKQQKKIGEEFSEDQINYIKNYLAKSDPSEIYERIPTTAQSKAATQEYNQYYNSLSQDELEKLHKQWIEENKIDEGKSEEEIQKEEQEIIKLQEKLRKHGIIKDVERKEFTDKAKSQKNITEIK